jgi:hypothetical protein
VDQNFNEVMGGAYAVTLTHGRQVCGPTMYFALVGVAVLSCLDM